MAKQRYKTNGGTLFKSLILIVLLVLLINGFFAIKSLSNDFKDDLKTFWVVLDGQTITSDTGNLQIFDKKIAVYDLMSKGYSYKIVSNKSWTFDFQMSGKTFSFADKEDYTSAFEINAKSQEIIVKTTDMESVLSKIYGDNEVKYLGSMRDDVCYFTLIITSNADSSKQIRLAFFIDININVEKITLDKTAILF